MKQLILKDEYKKYILDKKFAMGKVITDVNSRGKEILLPFMYSPMDLGAKDYIFSGSYKILKQFLHDESYQNWDFVAKSVDINGKWQEGGRNVFLVMQNVGTDSQDLLLSLVKDKLVGLALGSAVNLFEEAKILSTIVGTGLGQSFYDAVDSAKTAKDKASAISSFFNTLVKENNSVIDRNKKIMLTLTSYPTSPTLSKEIHDLKRPTIKMSDVSSMFDSVLSRK